MKRRNPELHTIELSHGKARLTQPRLSDIQTVETGSDRLRDHDEKGRFTHRNRAAVGKGARRALAAPLRAARTRIIQSAGATPDVADELLADALAVAAAARIELGVKSVFVEGPIIAYAVESILAGYYTKEAASAGFLTPLGMKLQERAMQCETQATRAMTAALAAAKAMGTRRARPGNSILEAIEAAGTAEEGGNGE
jgi:hypothetical protein